jgi:uncharacterized protein YqcC (DUF446 family)
VGDLAAFTAALAGLERALKDTGLWDVRQPTAEEVAGAGAFGGGTMTFGQWLRWVLVPRAQEALEARALPDSSNVAAYAVRELDGVPYADPIIDALVAFDAAVEERSPEGG